MLSEHRELILTVREDLTHLLNTWGNATVDSSLRRESIVLRRLLVDSDYLKAWKWAKIEGKPSIIAFDLKKMINPKDRKRIYFAQAGGAYDGSGSMAGILVLKGPHNGPNTSKLDECMSNYDIGSYLTSTSIISDSHEISRSEIIKYVANKRGGAHMDSNRKNQVKFEELDRVLRSTRVNQKNAVFTELLSIGQALVDAPDTKKFLSAVSGV